jgi:uncharacterized membrane protein YqjE
MNAEPEPELFHEKFIPDEQRRRPLPLRIAIGSGLALAIAALAMICMNVLNSKGVWVTLLLVSVLTATAAVLWIIDSVRHPATELDDGEPT